MNDDVTKLIAESSHSVMVKMKFTADLENWIECKAITIGAMMKGLTFLLYHTDISKIEIEPIPFNFNKVTEDT